MKDAAAPGPALEATPLAVAQALLAPAQIAEYRSLDIPSSLPRDHPAWQRDVLAVSGRVRAIVARLRPVAVRVLTFWDHVIRRVSVGGRSVEVDPSGCYRLR